MRREHSLSHAPNLLLKMDAAFGRILASKVLFLRILWPIETLLMGPLVPKMPPHHSISPGMAALHGYRKAGVRPDQK